MMDSTRLSSLTATCHWCTVMHLSEHTHMWACAHTHTNTQFFFKKINKNYKINPGTAWPPVHCLFRQEYPEAAPGCVSSVCKSQQQAGGRGTWTRPHLSFLSTTSCAPCSFPGKTSFPSSVIPQKCLKQASEEQFGLMVFTDGLVGHILRAVA